MADYKPAVKSTLSKEVTLTIRILGKITLATLLEVKLLASRLKVPQTASVTITKDTVEFIYTVSDADPLPENYKSNRAWIDERY